MLYPVMFRIGIVHSIIALIGQPQSHIGEQAVGIVLDEGIGVEIKNVVHQFLLQLRIVGQQSGCDTAEAVAGLGVDIVLGQWVDDDAL